MSHIPVKSKSLQKKLDQQKAQQQQQRIYEEFIKCELCRKRLRQPKSLPCMHSFCRDCLVTYLRETVGHSTAPQKQITCPICLQTSKPDGAGRNPEDWVDHLSTNDFLYSYLEAQDLKDTKRQCDTCARQHKVNLATQWCSTCHDTLCEECVGFHNALRTTHGHNLIHLSKIRKMSTQDIISAPLCPHHKGETVTKYCGYHNEVACEKCTADTHKDCREVVPLKDAAQAYKPHLTQNTEMLDDEAKLAKSIATDRSTADGELNETQTELLQKIQAVRQKVNENLTKCEAQIIGELHDVSGRTKAEIQSEMKEAQRIRKSASKVHSLADSTSKYGSESHLIETIPPTAVEANHYKGKLNSLNGGIKSTKIEFIIDPVVEKAMDVNQLGHLRVTQTRAEIAAPTGLKSNPASLKSYRLRSDSDPEDEYDDDDSRRYPADRSEDYHSRRYPLERLNDDINKSIKSRIKGTKFPNAPSAEYLASFNGRTSTDLSECWFTGVEYLPDDRILAVDRKNYKIKVFGTDYNLQSEAQLEYQPFGLAMLSSSEFAISIPREKMIQFYRLSGTTLTAGSIIGTSDRCYGICYDGARFFAACSCASVPSIKVVIKSPNRNEVGRLILFTPFRPISYSSSFSAS